MDHECASKQVGMDAPSAKLTGSKPIPNSEQVNMPVVLVATMCPCTEQYGVDSKTDTRRIGGARFNPARSGVSPT